MYAFALWDRDRNGLFLARDPYGIKPLYFSDDGSTFRAASQVKALSQQTDVDTSVEPAGHVGFFLWGHVPEPYTLYRGIRTLPAGHSLWVDENGAGEPKAFEKISDHFRRSEIRATQVNGTPRRLLREALRESVEAHLMADVDVGLFLSAGLDSATLAALASECTDRLRTITLGFEEFQGTGEDEVPLAEQLAERYETEHETVWVTQDDFVEARDDIFCAMDQPTIDGVNSYFVSRAAADAGLKVALSGLGGDELFGGYRSFQDIPRLVNTVGAIPGVAVLGREIRRVTAPIVERMTSPKYAGLLELGHSYGGAYLLRRGLYMPWVSALESTRYMRSQLLRDTDWASMAHSLEVRVPLVDQRLLRTLGPVIAKHGLTKSDMAATPKKSLPESVRNRPKSGFTVPVREWLLADRPEYDEDRGLRGWARYVYSSFRGSNG
jgi:asparagine synthase (glutamine-hydrolysing)